MNNPTQARDEYGKSPILTMHDNAEKKSCKRCGRCMTVCPLYQTTFREVDVARGKLALLEMVDEDTKVISKRFRQILSRCLLCGACSETCANNLQTRVFIQAGRQLLYDTQRARWLENPLLKSLRKGELSGNIAQKGGALFQALFCKRIPESSGLHLRFPLSFFSKRSIIPEISQTPFLNTLDFQAAEYFTKTRVGLFVGCGANYLFPETAKALVRLLKQVDVQIVLPQDQVCCGLPAFVSGDMANARALARKNIEVFAALDLDVILTVCASCGSHLGDLGTLFQDNDPLQSQAQKLSAKHKDAIAFMIEDLDFGSFLRKHARAPRSQGDIPLRVGYHDPCHLRIGQGITKAPKQMIEALEGVVLIEASGSNRCCGHGGGFNLAHFDLSMQILDKRMEDFRKTEPNAIVTGCTGCLLQFSEGVSRHSALERIEVSHPLVLVKRWLGL